MDWTKRYVRTDRRYMRPAEVDFLQGDPTKAHGVLGWKPKVGFKELVSMMVSHDAELAQQECTLVDAGHATEAPMLKDSRVFVAGHRGLVGSAIARKLEQEGYTNLIYRTRHEVDLTSQSAVEEFFRTVQPEFVFLAAAEVGGILANSTASR